MDNIKAHWIFPEDKGNDGNPICSNCHTMIAVYVGPYDRRVLSPFCPCCGNPMEEDTFHDWYSRN